MVDPIMSDHLTVLMLRLKKELQLTSVVVTHDLDLLNRVADTVVFLQRGGWRFSVLRPTFTNRRSRLFMSFWNWIR